MPAPETPEKPEFFATTRWSVVLAARGGAARDATGALETLCRTYWPTLYGYARRRGLPPQDAEDATQAFFARMLEKDYLRAVQRERGRFRAFLQSAFKRFLSKERDHAAALKRGGGAAHLSLDFSAAEIACGADAPHWPADEVFERRWALTVLDLVMRALREEFRTAGKEADFDLLKRTLLASQDGSDYVAIAAALNISDGAVRVAAHRLRKRFRELFRSEVAQTVASCEDVELEFRHLVTVLARS